MKLKRFLRCGWLCERHTPLSMDAFDREIKGGP